MSRFAGIVMLCHSLEAVIESMEPAVDAEDYFLRLGAQKRKLSVDPLGAFHLGSENSYSGSPAIVQRRNPARPPPLRSDMRPLPGSHRNQIRFLIRSHCPAKLGWNDRFEIRG